MCAAVLSLEAIVLGLTTPVMVTVEDVSTGVALVIGLGLCVLCVVTAGMLRREWAYGFGWLLQVAALCLGFVISLMFVLGVVFAVLWGAADFLGRKIERERAEAFAAYDREHGL
jgi:Sec-independent protein secretion pathway component TatC